MLMDVTLTALFASARFCARLNDLTPAHPPTNKTTIRMSAIRPRIVHLTALTGVADELMDSSFVRVR